MGSYIPTTQDERQEMLTVIGADSVADLFHDVPDSVLLKGPLNLPEGKQELEVRRAMTAMAQKNRVYSTILRGAGAGNHNAPHAWHLDPDDIEIVDATIEVCDGAPSYVDANVAEYVDVIGRYCPWGARLVGLDDYR